MPVMRGPPFHRDLTSFGLKDAMAAPSPGSAVLPEIVFCFYQLLFCACTVSMLVSPRRGNSLTQFLGDDCCRRCTRTQKHVPILDLQLLLGYRRILPVACSTWNSNGWLYNLPSLDFAGGGPVHIASGWSALAYALVLGKRKHGDEPAHGKPHKTTLVFLGTTLIWFGWVGSNVCPPSALAAR